ncbi:uncharacterized protein F5891DRAFT_1069146 [Suillus fuscotomentosus]|uniref:Uncharacterized protein n=1 Tax=Suillus fuscotomentosus TaxID=1912939 RepID=A0AAD4DRK4_9AGAM|nr:uncharacterized protein F5891DRAFT_1069146 [Suillus fuscotomentosus]KAG1891755.1 hypothetical protein F5891DRAFT_1069146 [Suillus fuscotomentosus]
MHGTFSAAKPKVPITGPCKWTIYCRLMQDFYQMVTAMGICSEYNAEGHRAIYDHISSILGKELALTDAQSPPTLTFYATRNMLRPYFILGQIPDLLDCLAMVDTFRKYAVDASSVALSWQEYYVKEPSSDSDKTLLTERELKKLQDYVTNDEHDRLYYILTTKNLCLLHVHYLVTAPESCMLAERLNDYFPGCFPGHDIPSKLLFQHGLSDSEKQIMEEAYQACKEFILDVTQWEEEREEEQKQFLVTLTAEQADAAFEQAFREKFPPPCSQEELISDLDYYLNTVEKMIRRMEDYFPSDMVLERLKRAV